MWPTTGNAGSLPGTGARIRIIRTPEKVEEIRPAWSTWRGHRDADIDVYQTLLGFRSDAATPHVILVERDGHPDAILVGTASTTTLSKRIAYLTMPVPRVRVHRVATHVRSVLMRDHVRTRHSHWLMTLPDHAEAIYAGLSSEHRWKLRRDAKRFRAAFADLKITRFDCPERLEALIRDTEQVAATTYQRGLGVGFSDSRPIRELLRLEAKKGWLRGYLLYVGDRPCAFWIGCVYDGVFLSEYLGHDPSYAKHSPGNYLLTHVMEDLWHEGVRAIDFSIGEAPYKQRFGNRHWNESTVYLYAPTWTGMRLKALHTIAALINSVGKSLLERMKLAGRVKKFWRQRVTHQTSRTAVQ